MMQAVRQKHTKPKMTLRRALHALGYRFRLHRRELPGSPDIVLPKYKTAIFVHGCFWHPSSKLQESDDTKNSGAVLDRKVGM